MVSSIIKKKNTCRFSKAVLKLKFDAFLLLQKIVTDTYKIINTDRCEINTLMELG